MKYQINEYMKINCAIINKMNRIRSKYDELAYLVQSLQNKLNEFGDYDDDNSRELKEIIDFIYALEHDSVVEQFGSMLSTINKIIQETIEHYPD